MEGLHPKAEEPPGVTQQSSSSPSVCSLEVVQASDKKMNKVTHTISFQLEVHGMEKKKPGEMNSEWEQMPGVFHCFKQALPVSVIAVNHLFFTGAYFSGC